MKAMKNPGLTDPNYTFVQKEWHAGKEYMPVFLSRGETLDFIVGRCYPKNGEWIAELVIYPSYRELGSRPTLVEAMALLWEHKD